MAVLAMAIMGLDAVRNAPSDRVSAKEILLAALALFGVALAFSLINVAASRLIGHFMP